MKKNIQLLLISCCIFSMSCNTATPEKYFDYAVLNSNMLFGFADDTQLRQLESPSVKLGDNGQAVPMKRTEELEQKIKFIEEEYEKLKGLKETTETKEMLQASKAMFEYALPVYKNEYTQLAKAYDENVAKETLQLQSKQIHDKYYDHYQELYNKVIGIGKVYAEKHAIKVNWNVGA